VFDVSAAGLVSTPPLVLAKIAPARDRRSLWAGRMALAASVAGAIALGAWALRTGPGATNGPGTLVADASSFDDVPWHVADEIIAVHREVDDLFRVERINSARDLKVEFAQLFPEVEF